MIDANLRRTSDPPSPTPDAADPYAADPDPTDPDPTDEDAPPAATAWPRRAAGLLAAAGRRAVDALLPPRCLGCGAATLSHHNLCGACFAGVSFAPPTLNAADALRDAPADGVARLMAATLYEGVTPRLIMGFKHGDRPYAATLFARWMRAAGRDLLAQADLIAPVPLHRGRLIARRYNQAALLAQAVARLNGGRPPVCVDLLRRLRRTPSQGGLSARGRRRNVAGAFAVAPARRTLAVGARIVVIDDVAATGATLDACAAALRAAGAARVDGLVVARAL